MYRIKTNGKYVLLIEDLNITLSHENENGIVVHDSQFESSNDIKKLLRYLNIEKLEDNVSTTNVQNVSPKEKTVEINNATFVANMPEEKQANDQMFVKQPIDEAEAETVELPNIEETNKKEVIIEEKTETSNNIKEVFEDANKIVDTLKAVEETVVKEEVKETNQKVVTKEIATDESTKTKNKKQTKTSK